MQQLSSSPGNHATGSCTPQWFVQIPTKHHAQRGTAAAGLPRFGLEKTEEEEAADDDVVGDHIRATNFAV